MTRMEIPMPIITGLYLFLYFKNIFKRFNFFYFKLIFFYVFKSLHYNDPKILKKLILNKKITFLKNII